MKDYNPVITSPSQRFYCSLEELSVLVVYNVPAYRLEFFEDDEKALLSYPIDFRFFKVFFLNKERVVLEGTHIQFRSDDVIGTVKIEYDLRTQKFYRVSFSERTFKIRRICNITPLNKNEIMELLSFIDSCSPASPICPLNEIGIIATHSPYFLSIPNAKIYDLDSNPAKVSKWWELDNMQSYYQLFMKYGQEFEKILKNRY